MYCKDLSLWISVLGLRKTYLTSFMMYEKVGWESLVDDAE